MAKIETVQAPWFGTFRAQAKAMFIGAYVTDTSHVTFWIFSAGGTMLAGPFQNNGDASDTLRSLSGR